MEEKALVDAYSTSTSSPITGVGVDYSLYTLRGHYTRNADLRRHFVAMSVLGQAAFCLPGTSGCQGFEPARRGILAARVLARDPALVELWRTIYEPTAFLVGASDDYTAPEVAAAAGAGVRDDPATLADDDVVQKVAAALVTARPVQVDPERASIRVMGSRFVVDAYVLDQLLANEAVVVCGPVLAELLAGTDPGDRDEVWHSLASLPWAELDREAWRQVGEIAFELRTAGTSLPLTDIEIAVACLNTGASLWTRDGDFARLRAIRPALDLYQWVGR